MKKKKASDSATDDVLDHLRTVIRRSGRSQLDIQKTLGWGRSSISQIMTGQKRPTIPALFEILGELGVEASAFFLELYSSEIYAAVNVGEIADLRERVGEVEEYAQKTVTKEFEAHIQSLREIEGRLKSLEDDQASRNGLADEIRKTLEELRVQALEGKVEGR